MQQDLFRRAADVIHSADAILIGAGAGMGVDSGLPDFRGPEGFWRAYPPFRQLNLRFEELSNPRWFDQDPALAWGFFGHRLQLYRSTIPHGGFAILRRWAESRPAGYFIFTSNVDGQFQKAGFPDDRIEECHGSIHFLQCTAECRHEIWPAGDAQVVFSPETFRAEPPYPTCSRCGELARPNILMFGDYRWNSARSREQAYRHHSWRLSISRKRLVVIECGAGMAVPTVRTQCQSSGGTLIRINIRDSRSPPGGISLPVGAIEALTEIDRHM